MSSSKEEVQYQIEFNLKCSNQDYCEQKSREEDIEEQVQEEEEEKDLQADEAKP